MKCSRACFSLDAKMKHGEGEKEQNEISRCSSGEGLGKGLFGRASRSKKWCLNLGICDVFLRVIFCF